MMRGRGIAAGLSLLLLTGWAGVGLWAQTASVTGANRVISGVVVSAKTNHPLAEAGVTLNNTRTRKQVAEMMTDGEGRFSFANLPDGKYEVRASHRGYVSADFDEHPGTGFTGIVTGEGLVSTGLQFKLEPLAVLFGTVAEDSGDPVPQAHVSLYRKERRDGTGKIVRAQQASADSLGKFEIANLPPGKYYLCATGAPWYANHGQRTSDQDPGAKELGRISLDVAYAITCFPGVNDSAAAEPIVLAGGDRLQADVTMHAVAAVHVSLPPAPAGRGGMAMPQIQQEVFGFSEVVPANMSVNQTNSSDGTTTDHGELNGFPPGRYQAEVPGGGGEPSRIASIHAESDAGSFDGSGAVPMASVDGKVSTPGGDVALTQFFVALLPREGDQGKSAPVEKDGAFHIQAVRPGDYDVLVNAAGAAMWVTHLNAKGGSLQGHVLQVSSEPIELNLTAVRAIATVNGYVKRGGRPASGVFVALLPVNPGAGLESRQPNQSDSDGSFDFPNVPAGDYLVVAVEEGWTLDWERREVMAKYLANATRVTVPARTREVNLPEAVEVQAK